MFCNIGNLGFEDVSDEWGMLEKVFLNGFVYVDFDNDGDFDFVVNNINDLVMIYENYVDKVVFVNYIWIVFVSEFGSYLLFNIKV